MKILKLIMVVGIMLNFCGISFGETVDGMLSKYPIEKLVRWTFSINGVKEQIAKDKLAKDIALQQLLMHINKKGYNATNTPQLKSIKFEKVNVTQVTPRELANKLKYFSREIGKVNSKKISGNRLTPKNQVEALMWTIARRTVMDEVNRRRGVLS